MRDAERVSLCAASRKASPSSSRVGLCVFGWALRGSGRRKLREDIRPLVRVDPRVFPNPLLRQSVARPVPSKLDI